MESLESQVVKASINQELLKRVVLLRATAWIGSIAWPALSYMAYATRPLEDYAIFVLSLICILNVIFLVLVYIGNEKYFYKLATVWVCTYAGIAVLQTANVLFGSTGYLYLAGQPPIIVASHSIVIVLTFAVLEQQRAIRVAITYAVALASIVLVHAVLYYDQFESFYALAMLGTSVAFNNPAAILLLRVHFLVHINALDSARDIIRQKEQQEQNALIELTQDSITSALNRKGLEQALNALMEEETQFGVLALKLSKQSSLRERLGEKQYESTLKTVVELVREELGSSVSIARRESSEIFIWSSRFSDQETLVDTGRQILRKLDEHKFSNNSETQPEFRMSGSLRDKQLDASFMIEEVLFRLFLAKSRGQQHCFEA